MSSVMLLTGLLRVVWVNEFIAQSGGGRVPASRVTHGHRGMWCAVILQILLSMVDLLTISGDILPIVANGLFIIGNARFVGGFVLGIDLHVMFGCSDIVTAARDVFSIAT